LRRAQSNTKRTRHMALEIQIQFTYIIYDQTIKTKHSEGFNNSFFFIKQMFQFTWTILLWKITNIITTMQLHQLIVYKYINIKNNQRILYTKKNKMMAQICIQWC
jgi:hypothetical protein